MRPDARRLAASLLAARVRCAGRMRQRPPVATRLQLRRHCPRLRSSYSVTAQQTHGVAAANPLATEAGREILRAGGSAVDAAIAMQMVLTLVEPQSSRHRRRRVPAALGRSQGRCLRRPRNRADGGR